MLTLFTLYVNGVNIVKHLNIDTSAMNKFMTKIIAGTVSLILVTGIVLYSRADLSTDIESPRLTVSVLAVEQQSSFEVTRYFPAVAEAQKSVAIGSEIPGKITNIYVDDGDRIKAGEPLFELDLQLLETQRQTLIARVDSIKPELELIRKRLSRQKNLKQQSFSSEDNIDALEAQLSASTASIKSLEAQIDDINIRISKSTVYAPFDAAIQKRLYDEGAVIEAGLPVLQLVGDQVSEISTGLPSELVGQLNYADSYTAMLGETAIPVKLNRVLPEINSITRTQGVKFRLDSDIDLTASEYLRLTLTTRYDQRGFWIPNTALVEGPRGLWEIFVVNDQDRVQKYSVSVVYPSNPQTFVSSAIPDGSSVVVEGVHRLAQNVAVTVSR